MSWTKTLNTKGQYFRKFIQSLKSNTGSVCRNNKNSCHKNSWSLLGTLCFWSHDFTFLSTIIEWEFLIGKKQRAGINIISDIEKLLKWLPVIYTRNKNQWMGWSNRPYSNSKKKLHWKCLLEKGNSGKFCRKSRICSTPTLWWTRSIQSMRRKPSEIIPRAPGFFVGGKKIDSHLIERRI